VLFGLVFVLAGLAFKISAVPFHMWTPDVYEGAPTPVTTFFATAPKIAAMAILVRVAFIAFPGITTDWRQILTFVSIASMALGAFAAIGQTNIKRLMAYSSIGHMGFALVGLAAGTVEGAQSVIVYMAIYVVMTLGTFAAILSMRRDDKAVETISDLAGLARTDSTMAFFLATMMFSLAGVPPLAGFFAKFYVFAAAIKADLYGLSVIGVLSSCVGAYYYLRIVKLMYFDEPAKAFDRPGVVARSVLAISALLIIVFVFAPSPLTNAAMAAAQSLF
jgi:NADH-quinone oxidoreductase subunit N